MNYPAYNQQYNQQYYPQQQQQQYYPQQQQQQYYPPAYNQQQQYYPPAYNQQQTAPQPQQQTAPQPQQTAPQPQQQQTAPQQQQQTAPQPQQSNPPAYNQLQQSNPPAYNQPQQSNPPAYNQQQTAPQTQVYQPVQSYTGVPMEMPAENNPNYRLKTAFGIERKLRNVILFHWAFPFWQVILVVICILVLFFLWLYYFGCDLPIIGAMCTVFGWFIAWWKFVFSILGYIYDGISWVYNLF